MTRAPDRSRGSRRPAIVAMVVGAGALAALALGAPAPLVGVASALVILVGVLGANAISWPAQIGVVLLVILLVPIRRFEVPLGLPFELEPYRILVALLAVAWVTSLLIDPGVRLRRSGFEGPILAFALAIVASLATNLDSATAEQENVVKSLLFFASFFVLFYAVVSLVHTQRVLDGLLGTLVLGGALVGLFAVIESRTGWNAFDSVGRSIPFLEPAPDVVDEQTRGGRLRVLSSAQHPIALGAALVMLLPLALYLAKRSVASHARSLWWVATACIGLGAVATVSRTSILMLMAVATVFLILRPRPTARWLAIALVPAAVVVHVALPGTIGAFRQAFFPAGGLVADQSTSVGQDGQGRLADLGPAFEAFSQRPLVGQGFATRAPVSGPQLAETLDPLAPSIDGQILDNQWLGMLLETGILGVAAFLWLVLAAAVAFGREARRHSGPRGLMLVSIAASVSAFGVGMFFFDAFAFVQVTLLFFVLLALGASGVLLGRALPGPSEGDPVPHRPTRRRAGAGAGADPDRDLVVGTGRVTE